MSDESMLDNSTNESSNKPRETWVHGFLKENAIGIIIWVITAASWVTSMTLTIKWIDGRLIKLENANIDQLKWQVDQHSQSIIAMQNDVKSTANTVQQIYTAQQVQNQQLNEIGKKLDKQK